MAAGAGLRWVTLVLAVAVAAPLVAQVQTDVPPVVPGAKAVTVERLKIHGTARIYHSGSTELVPELQVVRADVAVLAFWEGYIMSTQQAAELARTLQAKVVVPTHCKPEEAVKLRDLLEGAAQVELMAPKVGPPGSRKVPLRFSMATLAVSYPRLRTRDEGLRSRHEPLGPLNPRVVDLTRAGEKPADYRTAGARPNGEIVDAFALVSVQKDAREEGVGLGGRRWQSAGDAEPERERAVHASQRLRLEDAYRGADPLAPNSAHLVDHRL